MNKLIENRGGRRAGAGRKSMYGEKMATVSFRVPASKKEVVLMMVRSYLSTLTIKPKQHEPEHGC
jgi:hypothetical protein